MIEVGYIYHDIETRRVSVDINEEGIRNLLIIMKDQLKAALNRGDYEGAQKAITAVAGLDKALKELGGEHDTVEG